MKGRSSCSGGRRGRCRRRPGIPRTAPRIRDYKRYGTTRLIAVLDIAASKVVGQPERRHRSEDLLTFVYRVAEGIKP